MRPNRFVLDNSVAMAWYFKDENSELADSVLASLDHHEAIVPAVWPLEVGNSLLVAERRQRLGMAEVTRILKLLENLPITVEQESSGRMLTEIFAMARDLGLSTYDASYLDLAMRLGIPISTLDQSMLAAAGECRLQIYDPRR